MTGGGTTSPTMSKSCAGPVDAEQDLELVAGLFGGSDRIGFVGFELGELQVETLVVELGEVAGLVAIAADVKFVFVVGEVVVGELLGGLGDDGVGEGRAYGEDGLLLGELELGVGLDGGGACAVEAPLALIAALEQAGDLSGEAVGIIDVVGLGKVQRRSARSMDSGAARPESPGP